MTQSQAIAGDGTSSGEGGGYSPHEHRPLAAYATLSATFAAGFAGSLLASRASGHEIPDHFGPWDVILAGAATHKISRLIAKDKATSFIRAPFVRFEEESGQGEVSEQPRGTGIRLAIGELLVCPYCLGQWAAGAMGVGAVAAPRLNRLLSYVFAAYTVSDFLQIVYKAADDKL